MLEYKKAKYKELVEKRKACALCPLHNPSRIEGGKYDCDHLDPWATWKGDLDAEIVVVGKDWNDLDSFIQQQGVVNPKNRTNKNLVILLDFVGINVQKDKLFFTNSILCAKEGGKNATVKTEWVRNCSTNFLRPLLDLIQPKLVIAMGEEAFIAVTNAFGITGLKFKEAKSKSDPIYITESMKCFAVYHPTTFNQYGIKPRDHYEQWERIIPHLPDSYKK